VYNDGRQEIRGEIPATPAQVAVATGGVALIAGEQASVTKAKPVAKQKLNVDYETAWVDGWLIYEDKTVAEVASEFNRRNRVKIVVDNPFVAARRLAFFRGSATDPESFVAALAVDSNIKIVRDEPGVLRVELTPSIEPAQGESELPPAPSGTDPV
jgi:ferric-dicitrate binding protein FerR (iron transport regulator)